MIACSQQFNGNFILHCVEQCVSSSGQELGMILRSQAEPHFLTGRWLRLFIKTRPTATRRKTGCPDTMPEDMEQAAPAVEEEKVETSPEPETPVEAEEGAEDIDYKAELERERNLRQRAEDVSKKTSNALLKERSRRKEAEAQLETPDEPQPEEPAEEEPKPVMSASMERRLAALEEAKIEDTVEEMLEAVSDNPDERELIRHHFDRLHDGSASRRAISATIEDAKILANKRKFMAEAERGAKKQLAQEHALRSVGGKVPTKQAKSGAVISDHDREIAKAVGMTPEAYVKYNKQLEKK